MQHPGVKQKIQQECISIQETAATASLMICKKFLFLQLMSSVGEEGEKVEIYTDHIHRACLICFLHVHIKRPRAPLTSDKRIHSNFPFFLYHPLSLILPFSLHMNNDQTLKFVLSCTCFCCCCLICIIQGEDSCILTDAFALGCAWMTLPGMSILLR